MRRIPLYPVLLAAYPALFLYAHNNAELRMTDLALPALAIVAAAGLLWTVANLVLRDLDRSGMLIAMLVPMTLSYGTLSHPLHGLMIGHLEIGRTMVLLASWAVACAAMGYGIVRIKSAERWRLPLNAVSLAMVAMPLASIAIYEASFRAPRPQLERPVRLTALGPTGARAPGHRPDIYFLVFDRYASAEVLQGRYGYDNRPFREALVRRGFFIADSSRANYSVTFLSLASTLNMGYPIVPVRDRSALPQDRTGVFELLQDNEVIRTLRSHGYRTIHVGSWYGPTRQNAFADVNYGYHRLRLYGFTRLLFDKSVLYPFAQKTLGLDTEIRDRVFETVRFLSSVPRTAGPKFVFAHFLLPHEPFVFNSDGSAASDAAVRSRGERESYVQQAAFTGTVILALVDSIIAGSSTPPVIIVQSDEGPYLDRDERKEPLAAACVRKRTSILNAMRLPGVAAAALDKAMTPVNTFRIVFREYLDDSIALLDDRVYYVADVNRPFEMRDVTANPR